MTLRTRLLVAMSPLFAALAILCAISLVSLTSLGARTQEIIKDNFRSVLAAQRMKEAVERLDDAAEIFVLEGKLKPFEEASTQYAHSFERELAVEEGNITERGEGEAVKKLKAGWVESRALLAELKSATDPAKAGRIHASALSPALSRLRGHSDEILAINQDAMVRKSDSAKAYSERLRTLAVSGAFLAALAAILLAFMLIRKAVHPLLVLQQAVRRLGEGDLAVRAELKGKDEISRLATDFNAMADSLHRYRKSSLGDLLRAQQAAQASIDSLHEAVVVFGIKGEVLILNRAAEELFKGFNSANELEPAARAAVQRMFAHVLGGRGPYVPRGLEEAVHLKTLYGDRYCLPSANPLHDEEGMTIGVTTVFQDVTRFKRFDELKNDMVSTVAHEFRTPLTSMRMAIHLCLEGTVGPLTPKQEDLLTSAREDCERLQTLVDDLLDLSRLQKGITPTNPESISARGLMTRGCARHREAAQNRSVTLTCRGMGEDAPVLADPDRIDIVFDNLIANALRYTPAGGSVEVSATREEGKVHFTVTDTGPGIPKGHREHLFDKFYQVPGVEGGAAGLGLSICREIIVAHGGEIGVESEAGTGSTFWFYLNEPSQGEGTAS